MKTKLPSQLAKNVSKQHKYILSLLISEESPFKNYTIRQEYPVQKINPNFPSGREKYDIVIKDLSVVIEIMGTQHYNFIPYFHETKKDFLAQQERDHQKQMAAEGAGWAYIVIKYNEATLPLEELIDRIQAALDASEGKIEFEPKNKCKIFNNKKLRNRGLEKPPKDFKYKWPKRKIQSRKLP